MSPLRPAEPDQHVKQRRDAAISTLVHGASYIQFLCFQFERRGDEVTAILPLDAKLIGNRIIPAIRGGVTAAFMEVTASIEVSWPLSSEPMANPRVLTPEILPPCQPGTIDFAVDYLRPGLPKGAHARARVNRSGRRYAPVHVEAGQVNRRASLRWRRIIS